MENPTPVNFKHGHGYGTPTYQSWRSLRARCDDASRKNYGAKGISYCERWESFELFLKDMGERPEGMTLDRIDSSKDYCPENCKWSGSHEQSRNKRNSVKVIYEGTQELLVDLCLRKGVKYQTVYSRLKKGWSVEDAVNRPPIRGRQSSRACDQLRRS